MPLFKQLAGVEDCFQTGLNAAILYEYHGGICRLENVLKRPALGQPNMI